MQKSLDFGPESRKDAYYICEKLYIENIDSERVKPYWIRGLNIIFDEINVCKQETITEGEPTDKFLYKGQIGGIREFEGIYIDILPATFKDMCAKHGLKHTQLEQEWRDNSITEVDKPDNKGKRKSQKTTKIDGESKKVIRLIKKEVYKTLDIEVPNEQINKALLKHEISTHLKYYNTIPEEQKESFPQSFFREYPIHRKKCTADNILNMLLEIEAESRAHKTLFLNVPIVILLYFTFFLFFFLIFQIFSLLFLMVTSINLSGYL